MNVSLKRLNQAGFDHVMVVAVFVVLFALVGSWFLIASHASTTAFVNIHLSTTSGPCLNGTTITRCSNTSDDNMWHTLSGKNFQIKSRSNQCIDDWNGAVQTKTIAQGGKRVPVQVNTCYSNDPDQEWNWSGGELVNVKSHGCINDLGGSKAYGTEQIIYACNGASNEIWKETSVTPASSGGGSQGGGSSAAQLCEKVNQQFGAHLSADECNSVGIAVAQVQSNYREWNNPQQLFCLGELWYQESSWNKYASNPGSGAYGIPQSLPGSKMASAGADWRTNAATQIKWGLAYIKGSYSYSGEANAPCTAEAHEISAHWYVKSINENGVEQHS